jgi:hypothetical protein
LKLIVSSSSLGRWLVMRCGYDCTTWRSSSRRDLHPRSYAVRRRPVAGWEFRKQVRAPPITQASSCRRRATHRSRPKWAPPPWSTTCAGGLAEPSSRAVAVASPPPADQPIPGHVNDNLAPGGRREIPITHPRAGRKDNSDHNLVEGSSINHRDIPAANLDDSSSGGARRPVPESPGANATSIQGTGKVINEYSMQR